MSDALLLKRALQILLANERQGYAIPGAGIYPFQWKWDSGFIALGYSHFDLQKAMAEMQTLFNAQWLNGFVPHIIFHSVAESKNYFPDAAFYRSLLSDNANLNHETTTLTQPPVEGWVLERIFQIGNHLTEVQEFVRKLFPKIMAQHEYLYECRDPFQEGLVYIQHNWESGTDNSPVWDEIWRSFEVPEYNFSRKDTQVVKEEQRPAKREYDYYLYLIDLFKKWRYSDAIIAEKSPFLVQDPLFNSMLVASNKSLIRLGKQFGFTKEVKRLERWNEMSISSFNEKLFDKEAGMYRYFDLRNDKWLDGLTSSGFAPLFAGIPSQQQMKQILVVLERFSRDGNYFLTPSFDPEDDCFESQRYWRGPVWVNMNWLIFEGLKSYGESVWARRIKEDTLQMVREQGFFEYFEPDKEKSQKQQFGYGGKQFSWTAALIIDLLNDKL
ncbi:MAG: hypothetical protein IEMM0006_2022 [bacterium]|nr:MAG: hypothetical protein IEMM0006_2022 [bacterium]